jgi:hypothetical protein
LAKLSKAPARWNSALLSLIGLPPTQTISKQLKKKLIVGMQEVFVDV